MDFTQNLGKTTALKDALFLLMQELTSFPTLLLPQVVAQGNHERRWFVGKQEKTLVTQGEQNFFMKPKQWQYKGT